MSARTKARKRALDILYAADVRQIPLAVILGQEGERATNEPDRQASWMYARTIVEGVRENQEAIDELITTHSQGWSLDRMPTVDRAVLRIAVWEIVYNDEVPVGVAIDEAVEAAKTMSTDDSPRFVNGLLSTIAHVSENNGVSAED